MNIILLIGLWAIYEPSSVSCEPHHGKVWEPMHFQLRRPPKPELVKLNIEPGQLPELFDVSHLPKRIQEDKEHGEQIRFKHIGVVDMLSNRQPDDPFSMSTKFHMFNGIKKRVIKYKMYKNCLESAEDKCLETPYNLRDMYEIYNPYKRTLIIIGGFFAKSPSDWQLQMADKWLKVEDLNVIIVSWNKGNKLLYSTAVSNTKVVARQIVALLYYLARLYNIDPRDKSFTENIMLVGHSLGAHIAGFVGQDFGGQLGRITGLDPAGPSFSHSHESHRLDRNDAQFVDVIHTNADFGIQVFLGIYTQVGHVDFYANDGKWQPSCRLSPTFLACNHGAVIDYYLSILDHELTMSYQNYDGQSRDHYRIVAYRAASYNQFRSGKSMLKNCPQMALDAADPRNQSGRSDFTSCGIPLDFIKPSADIRREMEQVYGINFDPLFKPTEKYWFFTSPKMPFVVEHNLIKLHYELPHVEDGYDIEKKQCSLKMTYIMLDGEKSEREVPKFKPHLDGTEHPHTTIPFINHNLDDRYQLIELDSTRYHDVDRAIQANANDDAIVAKRDEQIISNAYGIFPAKIELDTDPATSGSSSSSPSTKKSTLGRMMSCWMFNENSCLDVLEDKSAMCRYQIKTIRVQPLRKTNRLFMGVYSMRAAWPGGDALAKKKGKQSDFKPRVVWLKPGESLPDIQIYGVPVANPTVYLDTIIVGPATPADEQEAKQPVSPSGMPRYHLTTPYDEALIMGVQKPIYSREYRHDLDLDLPKEVLDAKVQDTPYDYDNSNYDFTSLGS